MNHTTKILGGVFAYAIGNVFKRVAHMYDHGKIKADSKCKKMSITADLIFHGAEFVKSVETNFTYGNDLFMGLCECLDFEGGFFRKNVSIVGLNANRSEKCF
jgi:hypothetical protein